ncbi:MAG: transglutaminase-like domain-containing protein [Pirellulales bacterium]
MPPADTSSCDRRKRYNKKWGGISNRGGPQPSSGFHSLFIALSRAKGVPARFEIGFSLPPERGEGTVGGYHCWAFFHIDERGWVPMDISEADKHPEMKEYYFGNLTEDRVTFTTGRDIDLVPKQDDAPLIYFVVPYVEVDGTPWPKKNVTLSLAYADVKGTRGP